MKDMKALPISVYTDKGIGNCSNNGISERFDKLLIVHDSGFIDIDPENPPENLVKLVVRNIGGREYKHLEPVVRPDKGCVGWMFGGDYAGCSDSRFREISDYPLPIHDRQESQEMYDMLSR